MKNKSQQTLALIILDGFGYREETDANAIAAARKPTWDKLWHDYPHTLISGSGQCVGLPDGQMGNSEVGHLNMGTGRIVYQDFTRINLAIETGDFFKNQTLIDAMTLANQSNKAIHIMGLLSPGGVHSHENHIHAAVTLTAKLQSKSVYIHAFLDGRDTPPQSAMASLQSLDKHCKTLQCGHIASLIGRYYAMDRDKRWDRIQKAYDLLVDGKGDYTAISAEQGLEQAYSRGESDEFVLPTTIHAEGVTPVTINDGDVVLFMNFRSDRAREITQSLIDTNFQRFSRERWPQLASFVCLSEYDNRFPCPIAFPPIALNNILSEYLSRLGIKQLRIAETEKYAHVTFFFNGGIEHPYPGEDRILIPSPNVPTYDLCPEMSAPEITTRLIEEIKSQKYELIVCNFANPDMVGHTGNFDATVKAIEVIDACLQKIIEALQEIGGELLITADHGNAEKMFDSLSNQPHTAHTNDPVPFIYRGRNAIIANQKGKLSDISPTILYLLGLSQPKEMTGSSLVKLV